MKLNIHYYQHVNHEGLAAINKWADLNGHTLSKTNFKNSDKIPNPDLYDLLIVLGGPMSVNDDKKFPWLLEEKKSINRALNDGKKVLGICLGAQLISDVLGSKVYKSNELEIGWHNVTMQKDYKSIEYFSDFPSEFESFHWHGETFELPEGTTLIASSQACTNQIFSYGDLAVGFQFHLEQNAYSINRMIERANEKLTGTGFVQTKEQIIENIHNADLNNKLMFNFLDKFTEKI